MITKVQIEEIIIPDKRLGRHIEHDERSRAWAATPSKDVVIRTVSHTLFGGILNQNPLSSCTGNAAVGVLNTKGFHKLRSIPYKEPDAVDLYSLATSLDEFPGQYPPDDNGSSGLGVAKAAQQRGYITEYRHAFSIDDALTSLMNAALITGVNWYEGFDNPDSHGLVKIAGQIRGGHEFAVVGYNVYTKMVHAVNSWGPAWGHTGRFFFSLDTWAQLLSEQGDATVLVK